MVAQEVTAEERQAALLDYLHQVGWLDATRAWTFGHNAGFYRGGEGYLAKTDLKALSKAGKAIAHDGFWRHINEPDHMRKKYKNWADYWTPKTTRGE